MKEDRALLDDAQEPGSVRRSASVQNFLQLEGRGDVDLVASGRMRVPSQSPPTPMFGKCIAMAVPGYIRNAAYLEGIPLWLRSGPPSPVAYLTLALLALILVSAPQALAPAWSFPLNDTIDVPANGPKPSPTWLLGYRAIVGAACLWPGVSLLRKKLYWPFVTYTIQSFMMLASRLFLAAVGSVPFGSPILIPVRVLAAILRGPAIITPTIVVSIWWLVLMPLITMSVRGEGRKQVLEYAFSPFVLVVHTLNFPIAVVEFCGTGEKLTLFDLWVTCLIGYGYLLFYLLCLDRHEVHLYFILSPRTAGCAVMYLLIFALYGGVWAAWNGAVI